MTNLMTGLFFSDETTFHVSGEDDKHNALIWGTENQNATLEHVRGSTTVNVFGAMSKKRVYVPFFYKGATVNDEAYLNMLKNCWMNQLHEKESGDYIFQWDGVSLSWSLKIFQYLNTTWSHRWIGRSGRTDCVLLRWFSRSPDLNPCNILLRGTCTDWCTYLPISRDREDLKA